MKQVPFDCAQGGLSAPLKYASLRMTEWVAVKSTKAARVGAAFVGENQG